MLIREYFPDDYKNAVAVAHCESRLKVNAYNPSNNNGSVDKGLYQVNSVHDQTLAQMGLNPWNPRDNVQFARYLYEQAGKTWRDWVCVTHRHIALR